MKKAALMLITFLGLTACSQGVTSMPDRTQTPCGNKPNCVSTQDQREEHHLEPFTLTESATLDAMKDGNYLRIECTSKIMRFVDDLELKIDGNTLIRTHQIENC